MGYATGYYYDKNGNLLKTVNPDGGAQRFVYDFRNNATQRVEPARRALRLVTITGMHTIQTELSLAKRTRLDDFTAADQKIKETVSHWSYSYILEAVSAAQALDKL